MINQNKRELFRGIALVFCFVLFSTDSVLAASEFQSRESISGVVKTYLLEWYKSTKYPVEINVDKLDPRMKMPLCSEPLDVSSRQTKPQKGRVFVTVSCADQKSWRIFVPATIVRYGDIVMMVSSASRNQVIERTDLALNKANLNTLPRGYFNRIQNVVGKVARKNINANTILGPQHLKLPYLVKRGSRVTIIFDSKGVVIRAVGIALANVEKGKGVRVKNLSSGRIVEGLVIEHNVVKVSR